MTGLGAVSPLGLTAQSSWANLIAGKSGLRALQEDDLPEGQEAAAAKLPSKVVATIDRDAFYRTLAETTEHVRNTPVDGILRHMAMYPMLSRL